MTTGCRFRQTVLIGAARSLNEKSKVSPLIVAVWPIHVADAQFHAYNSMAATISDILLTVEISNVSTADS